MSVKNFESKAQKRIFERQQKIVFSYLDAKNRKENITEWKIKISEELNISVHAIDYTIKPANVKRIIERSEKATA